MTLRGRSLLIVMVAAFFFVGVLAIPLDAASLASGRFTDDDGHPGEVYLEWLAALGAVQGCDPPANTRICPDRTLSRAEASKILVAVGRKTGFFPPTPASLPDRFIDDNEIWDGSASRLANFLAHLGVISGCDPPANQSFCPNASLTRGQVAKMLVRGFGLAAPVSFESPWTDTAARFYDEAARVAAYHGLWESSLGRFNGGDEIDRAEFARVVVLAATGEDPCPANPFTTKRVDSLRRRFPGQTFAAYAYDTRTGCAYWMHPDNRLRTASVFKVMVMAGALLEAEEAGRAVSAWEWSQLVPMITESANNPVRSLWRHFGGSPWFRGQARIFGLTQTTPVGDTGEVWGRTTTSAKDQADLLRQVLRGEWGPLEAAYRAKAWDLMTSVVPSQTWGITAGVPSGWAVAQKNGFAGHIANSVGFVRQPDGEDGYVITVLSNGWSTWTRGVPVVDEISGWVSGELAR
jgi:hypothetical protein